MTGGRGKGTGRGTGRGGGRGGLNHQGTILSLHACWAYIV